jgi:hypothetical protein
MSDASPTDRRSTTATATPNHADEPTPNTAFNALIGGIVTVSTALIAPLSPVLGGAVAGYLEGGDTDAGLKVGALAGLVALVPLLLVLPLVLFFVPVFGPRGALGVLLVAVIAFVFVAAYTIGFSAVGGALGAYLEREV